MPLNLSKALFTFSASVCLWLRPQRHRTPDNMLNGWTHRKARPSTTVRIPIRRATATAPALPASRLCMAAARTAA